MQLTYLSFPGKTLCKQIENANIYSKMSDTSERFIQWKKLWLLISGINLNTPNEIVLDKLREVSKELIDGVRETRTLDNTNNDIDPKYKKKLQPIIDNLQHYLNMGTARTWNLLCYYLVNEFRGSPNSLLKYHATEANMMNLMNDIWRYYSLERLVMLRIVRNVIEYHKSASHPYCQEYCIIVNELKLASIRKSYIDQLEFLIKGEANVNGRFGKMTSASNVTLFDEQNAREMIEVLNIILLAIEADGILPSEFKKLVELFKMHSFGRYQYGLDPSDHKGIITKLIYSEVAIFLMCADVQRLQNETSWIAETIQLLDHEIVKFYQHPEHGPVLFAWMLLCFNSIDIFDEDDNVAKYKKIGDRAARLGVFDYLCTMIRHPLYNDQQSIIGRIVRKTIYNHLTQMCNLCDDGSLARHAKIFELFSEVLRTPIIAKDIIGREDGALSLFNIACENFPTDFLPLTMIAGSLACSGVSQHSFIREKLENLPMYAEVFNSDRYQLRPSFTNEDEFILMEDYSPFPKIEYTIPAGTSVIISDRNNQAIVHFKTKLNYFDVLHNEINQLLTSTLRYTEIDSISQTNIEAGLKCLTWTIQRLRNPYEISSEMVHPTEMVFDIWIKFKNAQNPPVLILARCFEVCSVLVPLFANEIFDRIINLNILPFVTNNNLDYHSYCNGMTFESGLVGHYLVNFEKNTGKFDFLLAYLNFVKTYWKLNRNNVMAVEIPGLIFILREIFPHVHTWHFEKESDRQAIYSIVMQYFFDILQMTTDELKGNEMKILLRNICVYNLLTNNGLMLLRFVAVGNDYLQSIMMDDPNWMTSSQTGMNFFVQRSMTILMQILRLRTTVFKNSDQLSQLESIIYTQPKQLDNLRIIPVVTGYLSNMFNSNLPLLACRLLRRFAIEFHMSLLACLDMEPDQIRLLFLQKLHDEMESDELKVNIIEFVEACINKQPGLTEAFFKISYESEYQFVEQLPKTKEIADGILIYMSEYLETISEDSDIIANLQISGIMSLFHAIWKNNMQSLVQDLITKPNFWSAITSPLHGNIDQNTKAYSQIFNILGIELFRCTATYKMDENLRKAFENFLKPDIFNKWIKHVLTLPNETIEDRLVDETPEWLCRLQSFKDLIVMLVRKDEHVHLLTDKAKSDFTSKCLDVLVERSCCCDDFRPVTILSEVYLLVLISMEDTAEYNGDTFDKMVTLMNSLSVSYADIHTRAKESILALAFKTIDIMPAQEFGQKMADFVRSVVDIICLEITETEIRVSTSNTNNLQLSFILSINLLKKIAMNFIGEDVAYWTYHLKSSKLFNRILSCLNITLPLYQHRRVVIEMLDFLIIFAKGNASNELLHCDVANYLWLKLLPPKELLQFNVEQKIGNEWETTDWWPIYARGIDFVFTMLRSHGYWFLNDALLFVSVHEEYLTDSILLAKQALDDQAIILVKTSLEFVCELLNFEKEWNLEHSQSMNNLMRCVQIIIQHSVYLVQRPKILKQLMDNDTNLTNSGYLENLTPSIELIGTMNNLIEILIICSRCMLVFSPKLLNLLTDSEFLVSQWQPLFEIQFNAPKLKYDNPQLSIDTILSIACLLTRVLSLQSFSFHEEPLNDINQTNVGVTCDWSKTLGSTSMADRTIDRSCFKSTSLTLSSAILPSEILSNLDDKICFTALEHVLTLLASQSLLALKDVNLSNREKQLIKRELSTELHVFHDWIKKTLRTDSSKGLLYRKKYGLKMVLSNNSAKKTSLLARRSPLQRPNMSSISRTPNTEVRLNAPASRSLNFNMPSSTPFIGTGNVVPINFEESELESTDEPVYTGLSSVKMVEEDYVQFLSNIFTLICQSE